MVTKLILHHPLMSASLRGFIHFKRASRYYNVSRSTLDRRRDKAREEDDPKTYAQFVVHTRSGQVIPTPTKEQVEQFIKKSEAPQWYVSKAWLEKEYGRRDKIEQGSGPSARPGDSEILAALQEQYEARIADLKEQLSAAHVEKKEILKYAQEDKQLFSKGIDGLTRVVALPGIAEAAKAQRGEAVPGVTHATAPAAPASRPDEDSPRARAAQPDDRSQKPSTRKRRIWNWFSRT